MSRIPQNFSIFMEIGKAKNITVIHLEQDKRERRIVAQCHVLSLCTATSCSVPHFSKYLHLWLWPIVIISGYVVFSRKNERYIHLHVQQNVRIQPDVHAFLAKSCSFFTRRLHTPFRRRSKAQSYTFSWTLEYLFPWTQMIALNGAGQNCGECPSHASENNEMLVRLWKCWH